MSWFAIDTDLEDHPKFHALITARGWTAERGLAFVYRLFRAVRLHAVTGDITEWDDRYIGLTTRLQRPAGIVQDLVTSGFVDHVENRLVVHGWMGRNGIYLKENIAREQKVMAGRKGGAARAANAPRDKTGRYAGRLDGVWPVSGVNKTSRQSQTDQREQEQEQEQEQEPRDAVASSPDGEDLTPAAPADPSPDPEAATPGTQEQAAPLGMVHALATVKALATKPADPRGALFDLCKRHANAKTDPGQLMGVASWLWFTHGKHDLDLVDAVLERVSSARNPYALLQPGGKALEAMVGEIAVARAEREQREHRAADVRAGLVR